MDAKRSGCYLIWGQTSTNNDRFWQALLNPNNYYIKRTSACYFFDHVIAWLARLTNLQISKKSLNTARDLIIYQQKNFWPSGLVFYLVIYPVNKYLVNNY